MSKVPWSEQSTLGFQYSVPTGVIIDEISMVLHTALLHIYKRLCIIFGCSEETPYSGKDFLTANNCDLRQLLSIRYSTVYAVYNSQY